MSNKLIARSENNEKFIEGRAAVFNSRSKLIAERGKVFYEYISPGAFDELLADRDNLNCIAVVDHDRSTILAKTRSNTLELWIDNEGLNFRFAVPDTQHGKDVYEMVQRGDYDECSFRYFAKESDVEWSRNIKNELERRVNKVSALADVSICIDGAFADTPVQARGLSEFIAAEEAAENEKELTVRVDHNLMEMSLRLQTI